MQNLSTIPAQVSSESVSSLEFWRKRAMGLSLRLQSLVEEQSRREASRLKLEKALGLARKSIKRGQVGEVGKIAASLIDSCCWVLALDDGHSLRAEAGSDPALSSMTLGTQSAMRQSFERQTAIIHELGAHAVGYEEDPAFTAAGAGSFLCAAFQNGAIALGARAGVAPSARETILRFAEGVSPEIRYAVAERRVVELRQLTQSLALRLFGAADAERARLARDLHDHQAQLLSAAQIALRLNKTRGAALLKRVERELRSRIRALRPLTVGRQSIWTALPIELNRLSDAGIQCRLELDPRLRTVSRPLQNVFLQVLGEAMSNVLRHSRARHAEVSIRRDAGFFRLAIRNDGVRRRANSSQGFGLKGLADRIEWLGGTLELERSARWATLIVRIPEFKQ